MITRVKKVNEAFSSYKQFDEYELLDQISDMVGDVIVATKFDDHMLILSGLDDYGYDVGLFDYQGFEHWSATFRTYQSADLFYATACPRIDGIDILDAKRELASIYRNKSYLG